MRVVPKSSVEQRRQELADETTRIDEAHTLGRVADDRRADISRQERKRDAFAALGKGHVEVAQQSYDPRFNSTIEWEPVRSKLTGSQLAAGVENSIVGLRQELATIEARIAELLA